MLGTIPRIYGRIVFKFMYVELESFDEASGITNPFSEEACRIFFFQNYSFETSPLDIEIII